MSKLGKKLIAAANEGIEIARNLETHMKHFPLARLSDVQELAPVYLVERDFGKNGTEIIGYREHTRSKVVELYKHGEWDNVVRIIEINESEGTCRNVLEDIQREAGAMLEAAE